MDNVCNRRLFSFSLSIMRGIRDSDCILYQVITVTRSLLCKTDPHVKAPRTLLKMLEEEDDSHKKRKD